MVEIAIPTFLYLIVAATVTFVVTVLFGDLSGDPPPMLIGIFWPASILVCLAVLVFYLFFCGPQALALKAREWTAKKAGLNEEEVNDAS